MDVLRTQRVIFLKHLCVELEVIGDISCLENSPHKFGQFQVRWDPPRHKVRHVTNTCVFEVLCKQWDSFQKRITFMGYFHGWQWDSLKISPFLFGLNISPLHNFSESFGNSNTRPWCEGELKIWKDRTNKKKHEAEREKTSVNIRLRVSYEFSRQNLRHSNELSFLNLVEAISKIKLLKNKDGAN